MLAFHDYSSVQVLGPRFQVARQLAGARRLGTGAFCTETLACPADARHDLFDAADAALARRDPAEHFS